MKQSLTRCLGTALCALAALLLATGCERDFSSTPAQADLLFSADTVSFDTIVAGLPTPTLRVALRNVGDADVTVGSISLLGDESSPFMVNINGVSATHVENVRLCHDDSLLVFISVRDASVAGGNAFRGLTDRIVAQSGANEWDVVVSVLVRNVKQVRGVLPQDEQWLCDSIPYLITDSVSVGKDATLLIGPGVTVLMESDAFLDVEGRLVVAGEVDNRTTITAVRQDGMYTSIPGQWGWVYLYPDAVVDIRNCDIACSAYGVLVDSASTITADGLWVRDTSRSGVTVYKADASFSNTIISDCGKGSFTITGGRTLLRHVTMADYYSWDYRKVPTLSFDASDDPNPSLTVYNSIIMGNQTNEVEADSCSAGIVLFKNSLVRAEKKKISEKADVFVDCAIATEAHFADRDAADYHLTGKSGAISLAEPSLAVDIPTDFEGVLRETDSPWQAGALQSVVEN